MRQHGKDHTISAVIPPGPKIDTSNSNVAASLIDLSKKKPVDPWERLTQHILLAMILAVLLAAPVAAAARVTYDVARWAWGLA